MFIDFEMSAATNCFMDHIINDFRNQLLCFFPQDSSTQIINIMLKFILFPKHYEFRTVPWMLSDSHVRDNICSPYSGKNVLLNLS